MKLTIAIATYNQPKHFRITLESIFPQLTDEVDVLVRDDSDNTESADVFRELIKKYPDAHANYFLCPKEGLDAADFWLMENAKGEYVWWLGDDTLTDGAIKTILYILENPNIDFIWVNSTDGENKAKNLGDKGVGFYFNGQEVLDKIGDMLCFLSALVFKRERYLEHIQLGKPHIGTCMAYLYPMLQMFSENKGSYFYCDRPLVITDKRPEKDTWYDPLQVFATNYFNCLDSFKGKLNIKAEKNRRAKQLWKGMLVYRATNKRYGLGKATNHSVFRTFKQFPLFWLYAPLFLLPRKVLELTYKLYGRI